MRKYLTCLVSTSEEYAPETILLLYALNTFLFLRIYAYSWVTDDAMITFRPILNVLSGIGPVYNLNERVQPFTSPLWFLLSTMLAALLKTNLYFLSIAMGLFFSLVFQYTLFAIFRRTGHTVAYITVILVLSFSEAFLSFQTSGLESSLTHCLLTVFYYYYLVYDGENKLYLLAGVGGLIMLNRMDEVFLIGPPLILLFIRDQTFWLKRCLYCGVAMLPLGLWSVFSIVYYGFLFPNTKYAKIASSASDTIALGLRYALDYLSAEMHVAVLLLATVAIYIAGARWVPFEGASKIRVLLGAIAIHIAYIVYVGGDFMRGRFFVPDLILVCLALLWMVDIRARTVQCILVASALAISAVSYAVAFRELDIPYMAPGVENERNFYKEYLALNTNPYKAYYNHPWAKVTQNLNALFGGTGSGTVIGMTGNRSYWIRRDIALIDPIGLTDAFIARLPVIDDRRTGHFLHDIPAEYYLERTQGKRIEKWKNPTYQELARKIEIIVSGPHLFTVERWKAMFWVWSRYGI
jgi:arabinofuranosyltransferase